MERGDRMDTTGVGERIAVRRKELGLTQKELAEKLLVTNKAVSKWETGEGYPDITILPSLAKELSTSVDFLLTNKYVDRRSRNKDALKVSIVIQILVLAVTLYFLMGIEQVLVHYKDPQTFIVTIVGSLVGALVVKKLTHYRDFLSCLLAYGFPIGCVVSEIFYVFFTLSIGQPFISWFFIMPILYSTIMMLIVYGISRAVSGRKRAKTAEGSEKSIAAPNEAEVELH